jgi:hypothetical protein
MKSDEWLTPPEILAALGPFDLDPCAPEKRPWRMARRHYTKRQDGLSRKWSGRVWLNPPFGREVGKWLEKLCRHGNGVALTAARTETAWFFDYVWQSADAILFLEGRPHFYYVNGERAPFNSGAPICLIAYGKENAKALKDSPLHGAFVECIR